MTAIKSAQEHGFRFQGAWINDYCSDEEKEKFKDRRKELRKEFEVITLKDEGGKSLYIRDKKEVSK